MGSLASELLAVFFSRPPFPVKGGYGTRCRPIGGHYNPLGEALMHKRMEDIEIKYIDLQKTVDDLNVVVIEQQKEIRELRAMLTLLGKKLQDVSAMPSFDPDEKPPHY